MEKKDKYIDEDARFAAVVTYLRGILHNTVPILNENGVIIAIFVCLEFQME